MRGARAWMLAAAATGLVLRLFFGLGYWIDKPLTLDEQEYLLLARSLASGRGFVYPPVNDAAGAVVHFERPPVYPAVIAGLLRMTGHPWAAPASGPVPLPLSSSDVPRQLVVLQSILGGIGVWIAGTLARRAAGARAGVAGAFVAALTPTLVWTCGFAISETLYSVLALLTALILLRVDAGERTVRDGRASDRGGTAEERASALAALAAGLVAGVAVLTKEGMLFFLPLAGLWLLGRRRWLAAALLVAGALAAVSPWVARNYAVHHRFVLTAAHGGVTFWTGNNPLARGEGDLAANPDMKRARNALEAAHPGASAQAMDAVYYAEALRFIRERPADWAMLEARKLFYTIVPIGPSYRLHSRLYLAGSWLSYGVLAPLAAVGLWRLGRRGLRVWPVLLLAASVIVMSLVFFPQERFRIPVIDPALAICAAALAVRPAEGDPRVTNAL